MTADFKFSLIYLAITAAATLPMAGHSMAAAQLTLWTAVGGLAALSHMR